MVNALSWASSRNKNNMRTRELRIEDIAEIKQLHQRYYSELEFPNFLDLLCGFIIEDDNGDIIIAGGVEAIAETILVTNQEKSRIKIGRALIAAQGVSIYTCKKFGIHELHAFVNNDKYERHLMKHGFSQRSRALSMRIQNGKR